MNSPFSPDDPDMMRWAEPVIHDVICAAYRDLTTHPRETLFLVRCQGMLWRALLTNMGSISLFQQEIIRCALRLGLGEHQIEEVNRQIVSELMLVIASRNSRSPRQAAQASVQVAEAYRRLTDLKAARQVA